MTQERLTKQGREIIIPNYEKYKNRRKQSEFKTSCSCENTREKKWESKRRERQMERERKRKRQLDRKRKIEIEGKQNETIAEVIAFLAGRHKTAVVENDRREGQVKDGTLEEKQVWKQREKWEKVKKKNWQKKKR